MNPRRSVLYMPGANSRAMEKARSIDCDGIIFDLEDAVAPEAKALARKQVSAAVGLGGYGHRELVVRVNGLGTQWFGDDVHCIAQLEVGAILFPKVESEAQIDEIASALGAASGGRLAVWIMVETALAIQRVDALAAHPRVSVLVMGTTDLVTQLRGRHDVARRSVDYALQRCVIAARAAEREILDGVHLDFRNLESFRAECEQGRDMGFDGKCPTVVAYRRRQWPVPARRPSNNRPGRWRSPEAFVRCKVLIHPAQVDIANAVFGPSSEEVDLAQRVAGAWSSARKAGLGVVEVDGRLVEHMHAAQAERTLALARALAVR